MEEKTPQTETNQSTEQKIDAPVHQQQQPEKPEPERQNSKTGGTSLFKRMSTVDEEGDAIDALKLLQEAASLKRTVSSLATQGGTLQNLLSELKELRKGSLLSSQCKFATISVC